MADMKILNVNGTAYTVKDGGAVRADEAQSLDDTQQALARANIGAMGSTWRLLHTFDLSGGAVTYETDTAGCTELLMVTVQTATVSGQSIFWKGVSLSDVYHMAAGSVRRLVYLDGGRIVNIGPRSNTETLLKSGINTGAQPDNNTFALKYTTASVGVVELWGR